MSRRSTKPNRKRGAIGTDGRAAGQPGRQVWRGGDWSFALLLVAAVFIAYQPVWHAGFIWDDDAHLTNNPCIIGPLGFGAIWTSAAAVYYPLVLTSFWIQHAVWGLNPVPYHLVNIAMHAGCAILLWRVLVALDVRGARLGAGLWALHPVMVESAAWITELKNTQSCFFYLLAILFFLRWRKTAAAPAEGAGRGGSYALALLCAALAILSKSATVMLPVVLALCWWWLECRWRWRNTTWLAPFLFISLAAGAWTIWEQKYHSKALGHGWEQNWPERIVIAGHALWFYLGKLAWPHPLIFVYPRWTVIASQPAAWLPSVVAVVGLFILWRGRNGRMRPLFFAAVYFVVSLFPVLGFFDVYFFRYSFVGDHFQYLASMGPLALAAAGVAGLFDSWPGKPAFFEPAFRIGLPAMLGLLTWMQSGMYANVETLWHTTLARNPGCWMAHNNLGLVLCGQGREEEGIAHYRSALQLNPADAHACFNLGNALRRHGQAGQAIALYRKAVQIEPDYADARNNLGNVLLQQGRTEEAMVQFGAALRSNPVDWEIHYSLGIALLEQGREAEAISCMRRALELQPGNATIQNALAWQLAAAPQTSLRDGARALELAAQANRSTRGDNPKFLRTLAAAYAEAGDFPNAVQTARVALRLAQAHSNTAIADALPRDIQLYRGGSSI